MQESSHDSFTESRIVEEESKHYSQPSIKRSQVSEEFSDEHEEEEEEDDEDILIKPKDLIVSFIHLVTHFIVL